MVRSAELDSGCEVSNYSQDSCHADIEACEKLLQVETTDCSDEDEIRSEKRHMKFSTHMKKSERMPVRLWFLTAINTLMLSATIIANGWKGSWSTQGLKACVKATSYYSPILDVKEIKFANVHLNGTLWPAETESWSRKPPDDEEANQIWEDWEPVDTFPISREQVIALGKDPNNVAKYEDSYWHLGDDAYIASLDVLHKIHCINELRKMTFLEYGVTEKTKAVKQHGKLWWLHLRHCVDMLTQDMLCHADADLVTYQWRDTQSHPFPDFGINRKCRDINTLLEYRDENKVSMAKWVNMRKPKQGITQVPYEPGYYAMFGFDGSDLYPDGQGYPSQLPDTEQWFGKNPNLTYLHSKEYKEKQFAAAHAHLHHDDQ